MSMKKSVGLAAILSYIISICFFISWKVDFANKGTLGFGFGVIFLCFGIIHTFRYLIEKRKEK